MSLNTVKAGEAMDIDAEREKITQEIQELERILYPGSSSTHLEISESSLSSDSEAGMPMCLALHSMAWLEHLCVPFNYVRL